jgi:hypothetical protein
MIKVHIQAVAETAHVASKDETCWLAIAAAIAWLPAPEHTMTLVPLDADMADSRQAAPTSWNGRDLDLGTAVSKVYGAPHVNCIKNPTPCLLACEFVLDGGAR